jgi:hypothetical protein
MAEDMDNALKENAKGPKRAKGDSGEVEQHSLEDQIVADRYLNSKQAVKSKSLGIRVTKLLPPGAA